MKETMEDDTLKPAGAPAPSAGASTAETEALGPVDVEQLKASAAKAAEHWERVLRLTADLENYKKRAARERQDAIRFANEGLLEKLVPILDNFEMALSAASTTGSAESADALKTGVNMIHSQLRSALLEAGLEEIDATHQTFDPNLHEAVSQQPSDKVPEGQVLQQIRKGYKLRDRLLRPASVVVSKGNSK